MAPPRCDLRSPPPLGGGPSGPAKPDPRRPLDGASLARRRLVAAAGLWPLLTVAAPLQRQTRLLFGSPCEVLAPPGIDLAPVWAGLAAMNERWNAWKPRGLGPLNAALREGRAVPVDAPLRALIQRSAQLERASGGHFNPAIGGLVGAWGFHADRLRPGPRPSARDIERWTATRPSLSQLQWQGDRVRSSNPRLQLDLGAVAKGVAVDWALDRLQATGAGGAVVNLGGNLATLGLADGRPWQVGVRDPFGEGVMAQLATQGREAVITSGSYERQRRVDGQVLCHLIDPVTGQPAQDLVSVTVVHRDAALADAAATALLVAGAARWPAVATRLGLDQVLVVHRSGRAQATPRLLARLQLAPPWRGAVHTA